MDINTNLLNYTRKVNLYETNVQEEEEQEQLEQQYLNEIEVTKFSYVDYIENTTYGVESIGENISDEDLKTRVDEINFIESGSEDINKPQTTYVTYADPIVIDNVDFVSNTSDAEEVTNPILQTEINADEQPSTQDIKNTIYNLYNNSLASGYGIKDANSLFRYLHQNYPELGITKSTGITKEQLVALTQIDSKEDANNDFFGSLNRIFDELDVDNGDTLSYKEIEKFLGSKLMQSTANYEAKVDDYADKIQKDYEKLSDQGKLEYALDKTEEYLEAKGMDEQLYALNRLTGGKYAKSYTNTYDNATEASTDLFNRIHVGQISLAALTSSNPGWVTLGQYSSYVYTSKNNDFYSLYAEDYDDKTDGDAGLTLNIDYYLDSSKPWYMLVDTLVHELTHATAFIYTTSYGGITVPSKEGIERLHNQNVLSDSEYKNCIDNYDTIVSEWYNTVKYKESSMSSLTKTLIERINNVSGEFGAYQADADYVDSIAGDVYDGTYTLSTAVDGSSEENTISQHIQDGYISQYGLQASTSTPTGYQWWTYC